MPADSCSTCARLDADLEAAEKERNEARAEVARLRAAMTCLCTHPDPYVCRAGIRSPMGCRCRCHPRREKS